MEHACFGGNYLRINCGEAGFHTQIDCCVGGACVLSDPEEKTAFKVNESISPNSMIVRCTLSHGKVANPARLGKIYVNRGHYFRLPTHIPFNNTIHIYYIV